MLNIVKRWRDHNDIPTDWGRCVLTVGVFDGVHRGHSALISQAVAIAGQYHLPSVLMTFDPHPMSVVHPSRYPAQLTTLRRRADLVERIGVDVFLVMPFTEDFMRLSPQRYIRELLIERLHIAAIVIGENFTFGHKAAGTVETLREFSPQFGYSVHVVGMVSNQSPVAVTYSSTYIRSCVDAGDIMAATDALGYPPRIEGIVVHGDGRGRHLGFPTANVEPVPHAAVPADGVYAAWFVIVDEMPTEAGLNNRRYPAAVSVGTNPTFCGRARTIEAFILDLNADLYGRHVVVEFIQRIRSQERFNSVPKLVEAIDHDVAQTRMILLSQSQ